MAYAASLGVTTHLDQGAFQATDQPTDGSAHEDNFTMYNAFLSVYEQGDQRDLSAGSTRIVRLRTNYLLWDTDESVPIATQRSTRRSRSATCAGSWPTCRSSRRTTWPGSRRSATGLNALGQQINPGQQITRSEVLTHYTRANQWFLGGQDEDVLGSLEVGRLGDVVVLSDDYFSVPDARLRQLHSELTVLGGTVVHSGGIRHWA